MNKMIVKTLIALLITSLHFSVLGNEKTLIREAVEKGQVERVISILNELDEEEQRALIDQENLLHLASEKGFTDLVNILINRGANVNTFDPSGQTPLGNDKTLIRKAVEKGQVERVISILNELDENEQRTLIDQENLLHLASKKGITDLVNILINRGANVNAFDPFGKTPLMHALYWVNTQTAEMLLDRGANINATHEKSKQSTVLHQAVRERYGSGIMHRNSTEDHESFYQKHIAFVQFLLDRGANIEIVDANGYTPLILAVRWGHMHLIPLLLDHGANISESEQNTALHQAIEYLAPTHTRNETNRGAMEMVKFFLDRGADPNALDTDGNTPLALATKKGHVETAEMLLAHGADIDKEIGGESQTTVFHQIASRGSNRRAWIHHTKRTQEQNTITMIAMAQFLLDRGVGINVADFQGETLLILAVRYGMKGLVHFLLINGADVTIMNHRGQTAFDIANLMAEAVLPNKIKEIQITHKNQMWDEEISLKKELRTMRQIRRIIRKHQVALGFSSGVSSWCRSVFSSNPAT